jgi:hypothetical protein
MGNWQPICDEVLKHSKVVEKRDSRFMKFLNFFVKVFNPVFMTRYVTTIGKIYWPLKPVIFSKMNHARTLTHEHVHEYDERKLTLPFFSFLYLVPQVFVLCAFLALLAIWYSMWWLLALGFLLLLAPWPAPFRTGFEIRAMYYTFVFDYYVLRMNPDVWIKNNAKKMFGGWDYYRMCPTPIARWLLKRLVRKVCTLDSDGLPKVPKSLPSRKEILRLLADGGFFKSGANG